jgi:hypothetical protein
MRVCVRVRVCGHPYRVCVLCRGGAGALRRRSGAILTEMPLAHAGRWGFV